MLKGENKKAEAGFDYCVSCQRKKVRDNNYDHSPDPDDLALMGMALDWQAQFYLSRHNLLRAESIWREAVEIGRKIHGDDDEQVLVVRNSLATVISMQEGREPEAANILEELIKKATEINSSMITTFLVNLGLVKIKQGMFVEAKIDCDRAKKLADAGGDQEVVTEAEQCLHQVKTLFTAASSVKTK